MDLKKNNQKMNPGLNEKQTSQIRSELENCKKPLFFFHDDPDGVASFLLLYKIKGEGKGIIVKTTPKIDEKFVKKVQEYNPDKIFILDIAVVEQEFIDEVNAPIIWIDHHFPVERRNIKYFNPRLLEEKNSAPVSYICYQVAQENIWLSAVGCIGDWFMPDFIEEFREKYPDMLESSVKNPEDALFNSKLGELVKIFSFILNGLTNEVMKNVIVLTRIKTPQEILKQETPAGKFIYKKYEKMKKTYDDLIGQALKAKQQKNDLLYLFIYDEKYTSFTKDLANELIYRHPEKIIVVGRKKEDEIKMSIRSKKINLPEILEKALAGIEGYGGGHEYAVGANVKEHDFGRFIENLRNLLKKV